MRTVTLLALRTLIQSRCDIEYDTARHTTSQLNSEINNAIVELRGALTRDGARLYVSSATGSLPTTRTAANDNFVQLTAPATADTIDGIDVVDNDQLYSLTSVGDRERLNVGSDVQDTGRPCNWSVLDWENGTIAIYPVPDQVYTYVLWYQTQHTDLSDDTDTFTVLPGFVDWITWYVVEKIAIRDDFPKLKQDARLGMQASYTVALTSAQRAQRGEGYRRDTRRQRDRRTQVEVWRRM